MADVVAVVGIVSGTTVAVLVPLINSRLERRRLSWEGEQRRLDEFRSLVDTAALHLEEARQLLEEILRLDIKDASVGIKREDSSPDSIFKEVAAAYSAKTEQLLQDGIRISLRAGPDAPLKQAHNDIRADMRAYEINLNAWVKGWEGYSRPATPNWPSLINKYEAFLHEASNELRLVDG